MVEYSKVINNLCASMSQVFSVLILLFFDPAGISLSGSGINLPLEGSWRLWAKMTAFLQGGGAHKTTFHIRGDAASKFCLLCENLFTESSRICDDDGTSLLRCSVLKKSELVPAKSSDLKKAARFLEAKKATVDTTDDISFIELQQALGITYHPHSLLLNRQLDAILDPVKAYFHEWTHGLFVDGVVNITVFLLFEMFIVSGEISIYTEFSAFLQVWEWPGRLHCSHLHEIFSDKRSIKHRKAKHIKCQASDMLSLMGALAMFAYQTLLPKNLCNAACDAFLALADVVDFIVVSARSHLDPTKLDDAVEKFLDMFVDAFGIEWVIPKFHWLLHFGDHLKRFKVLLNCFVLERKHRWAKRYATELQNISKAANASVIMEVTSHHLCAIKAPNAFDYSIGLVDGRPASKKMRQLLRKELEFDDTDDVQKSIESRFNAYASCKRHDVVLIREGSSFRAGQVIVHASVVGVAITMVTSWRLHSIDKSSGYAKWHYSDDKLLIETADILDSVCHTKLPGNIITTLLPADLP